MRTRIQKIDYDHLDRVNYTPGQPPLINRESHKRKRLQEAYLDNIAVRLITEHLELLEDEDGNLVEAWSIGSRRKQAINLRRNKHKTHRGRVRARTRTATNDILQRRSNRRARGQVAKKYLKGRNKSDVSYAQKADVEAKVKRAQPRVKIIQRRLLPTVRADDRRR